jgi:hypothetical protein
MGVGAPLLQPPQGGVAEIALSGSVRSLPFGRSERHVRNAPEQVLRRAGGAYPTMLVIPSIISPPSSFTSKGHLAVTNRTWPISLVITNNW